MLMRTVKKSIPGYFSNHCRGIVTPDAKAVRMMNRRVFAIIAFCILTVSIAACGNLSYYTQAVNGHLDILNRRVAISQLLDPAPRCDDESEPACFSGVSRQNMPVVELQEKLDAVLAIRDYASQALGLPDNDSYRSYVELGWPYAVWTVFAAPEFELKPKEWCFFVVGCVSYRGYFSRQKAERLAAELREQGYDVFVGGVAAYSTLGWFDDPIMDTMLRRPVTEVAALIFHELAHQIVYIRDDTAFNESFATTVELEGTRRWARSTQSGAGYQAFLERRARHRQIIQLMLATRERLGQLYGRKLSDEQKRRHKADIFAQLKQENETLKRNWYADSNYDAWFARPLNNARLLSIGAYHEYVPAFQALLRRGNNDMPAFYREVKRLSKLPRQTRHAALADLTPTNHVGSVTP